MSALRALVRCDEAAVPPSVAAGSWTVEKSIASRGPAPSLNLRADNLAGAVLRAIVARAADLVRIAAYAYAADQDLPRGGPADVYGRAWRRHIALCLPVSEPAFWRQDPIRARLAAVLAFLTEDEWEFHFSQAVPEARQIALNVNEHAILQSPDTVVLFSGGADSLCAAVEAVVRHGRRPVLVSHRPAPTHDARQQDLARALREHFPQWSFPHLSFWVHRRGSDAVDNSQRSRAFLFASLGSAVGAELGIAPVVLGDNGIISLNLPFSGQLVGALASRSTHPGFIRPFNDLIAAVLPHPVRVENPLLFRTRAEVLGILPEAGCPELLQETNSCSRARGLPSAMPQCGYCSQCVDRRFGALIAGLEEHDLAERYGLDIFTRHLPSGEPRTVAESYVRFARELQPQSDDQLFQSYPQLVDALDPDEPALPEVARRLTTLVRRHAEGVLGAMATMIARHSHDLAVGSIEEESLLRLALATARTARDEPTDDVSVFMRQRKLWTLAFRGLTAHLNDARGLGYIAGLLRQPGQQFAVIDIFAANWVPRPDHSRTPVPGNLPPEVAEAALSVGGAGADDPLLDAQARAAYQARYVELRADLDQAEAHHNPEHAARIRAEMAMLTDQLKAASGLRGRARTFSDPDEKARQSVSTAIRRSLQAIGAAHPELGRHLHGALKLGYVCSYDPDPPLTWTT